MKFNKKYLFILLKLILFFVLAYFIYFQLKQKDISFVDFKSVFVLKDSTQSIYFFIAILLMPFNWFLESIKWKFLVNSIQQKFSFLSSVKSVLMGVFFGFITPNRVGEFAGRLFNIEKGNKIKALNLSFIGGVAQFVITLSMGVLFFSLGSFEIYKYFLLFLLPFLLFTILYFYFNLKSLIFWLSSIKFLSNYFDKYVLDFNFNRLFLSKVLLITLIRYCVYVLQYIFILYFLGVEIKLFFLFGHISLMLLIQTILPSFALIDVGIRGNVLLFLLSQYVSNQLVILVAVLLVWILNLVIPAIVGYLIFLNLKTEVNYEKSDININNRN